MCSVSERARRAPVHLRHSKVHNIITTLQGLPSSGQHSAGQHSRGSQTLECQHAFALLPGARENSEKPSESRSPGPGLTSGKGREREGPVSPCFTRVKTGCKCKFKHAERGKYFYSLPVCPLLRSYKHQFLRNRILSNYSHAGSLALK